MTRSVPQPRLPPTSTGRVPTAVRTDSGSDDALIPRYGCSTLADLMPSLGAHLGVLGCDDDPLGLPAAERYVVVLIDGLGWHLLRGAVRDAPYLAGLLGDGRPITSGVPSTTATSLTSLGTGVPPGRHGVVGYTSRVPQTSEILNALTWESDLDARAYQPRSTFFERATQDGVAVSSVGMERFEHSGLTTAGLRGARFVGFEREDAEDTRIDLAVRAATRAGKTLVYAYERELDHCGHVLGCDSKQWRAQLRRIDAMCARLRDRLPDDVRMVITGDHGMIDVPPRHRVIIEDEPDLLAGVSAFAGEGRFRQLYVDSARVEHVRRRWADRLGELAWVRTREEAIAAGWFGPVEPEILPRYGHVIIAMRSDWAVMTRTLPRELRLVGMHGSLTPVEMTVPLFWD